MLILMTSNPLVKHSLKFLEYQDAIYWLFLQAPPDPLKNLISAKNKPDNKGKQKYNKSYFCLRTHLTKAKLTYFGRAPIRCIWENTARLEQSYQTADDTSLSTYQLGNPSSESVQL